MAKIPATNPIGMPSANASRKLPSHPITTMKKTLLTILSLAAFSLAGVNAQTVIAGWDFNGSNSSISNPDPANTVSANVTVVGLTLGAGLNTSGTANTFGGTGFTINATFETAVTNGDLVSFSLDAESGFLLSVSSVSAYNIRRSVTGPTTGIWQYQIGAGGWQDIGTAITWGATTTAGGNAQASIDLSGITSLQNVSSGNVIGMRIVSWGATSGAGTWFLNEFQDGNDLVINGTVAAIPEPSTWALIGLGSAFVLWRIRRKPANRA